MSWGALALIITLAVGTLAAPLPARAQQAAKVPRIGILLPSTPAATAHLIEAFKQGLREHGYTEGQDIIFERRYGETRVDRLSDLAAELVRVKVDVIVTATDLAIRVTKQHTRTIPIVMVNSNDPVGVGLVASLARPGGNVTGLSNISPELGGNRLGLLMEAVPTISRVAVLWNPDVAGAALEYKELEIAARQLKLEIQWVEVRRAEDIDAALAMITRARVNALLLAAQNPVLFANRRRVADFATQKRLPTMYGAKEYVDAGGLMAYGPNFPDVYRRAAGYVDKILKGAKPGELPVEQPTKFDLVINLKTARVLGLTVPQSLVLQADHVIQ